MICTSFAGRRLLLLAEAASAPPPPLLTGWDVLRTDSLAHARFLQQFDPFDVVLVDQAQMGEEDGDDLGCLALPGCTSLIVLSDFEPDASRPQAGQGPHHWLPRRPALEQPALLGAVLNQAAHVSKLQRLLQQREQDLQISRAQADRLIELLWQGIPSEGRTSWLTQRRVLERLEEEVMRSQRYAVPLSVVLGELESRPPQPADWLEHGEWSGWVAQQISRSKRRCDVAGQYGPNGFLLLLPETTDEGASSYCRRLLPLLERGNDVPGSMKTAPRIRCAAASLSSDAATSQSLLSRAEERLTQACQPS